MNDGKREVWQSLKRGFPHLIAEHLHPRIYREEAAFVARMLGRVNPVITEIDGEKHLPFENHSHSDFSDGDPLERIVPYLFDSSIAVWSLTDHNTSQGYEAIASGSIDLNAIIGNGREYEVNTDDRYLIITERGPEGEKHLLVLRSIELMTDVGEIGVHGYEGSMTRRRPLVDSIKEARDKGAFVIVNHLYWASGIGEKNLETALKAGAVALEKNATEVFHQIYGPAKSMRLAGKYDVPLVASGDAHLVSMYAKAGISFPAADFLEGMRTSGNPVEAIETLIRRKDFASYFNYLQPSQLSYLGRDMPDEISNKPFHLRETGPPKLSSENRADVYAE